MRITGGVFKGRRLLVPATGIRPTQDKVRLALFSSLADRIADCSFLDLFAGCGSVGLEAASRGAANVCMIELDGKAVSAIRQNIKNLQFARNDMQNCTVTVLNRDARRYVKSRSDANIAFNVIYADPPYKSGNNPDWSGFLFVGTDNMLAHDGVFVLEQRAGSAVAEPAGWRILKNTVYGQTRLCYYTKGN